MELTGSFNSSAPTSGAESAAHGEAASGGGGTTSYAPSSGHEVSNEFNNNSAAGFSEQTPPDRSEETEDFHPIDQAAQRLNEGQNKRHEEMARISEENMRARDKFEDDIARRYGDNIRQLHGEINELQNVLNNSGPIRRGWLKLTRQISKDPERDLNVLQSTLEMNEAYQAAERQAFDDRMREQREAREAQALSSKPTQDRNVEASHSDDGRRMTRDQAAERIAFLEDHRAEPALEAHLRPGGNTEEFVHTDVAASREVEISALKAYVKRPDGPDDDPDHDPESPDQTPGDGFGPSL